MFEDRLAVAEALPLVNDLYSGRTLCTRDSGGVGGHLHIVLDDGNTDDGMVQFCIEEATRDCCAPCRELGQKIRAMSPTQRQRLYLEHE
jgi:hypothetical protein